MTPFAILGLAVLAVLATTILAFVFTPRRKLDPGRNAAGEYTPIPKISFDKIDLPTNGRRVFGKRLPK